MARLEKCHIFLLVLTDSLVKFFGLIFYSSLSLSFFSTSLFLGMGSCKALWDPLHFILENTKNKVNCSLICSAFTITTPAFQLYWAPYSHCAILIGGILSILVWPGILLPQLSDRDSYCTLSLSFPKQLLPHRGEDCKVRMLFFPENLPACFSVYGRTAKQRRLVSWHNPFSIRF